MFKLREVLLFGATAPLWISERYSPWKKRRFSWSPKQLSGQLGPAMKAALASKMPCIVKTDATFPQHYDLRELVEHRSATKINAVLLGEKEGIDQFGMPKCELTLSEVNDWIHTPSKGKIFAWLPVSQLGDVAQCVPQRLGWTDIDTTMSGMLISSKGYFTRIHLDWVHGFLSQLHGQKPVTLIAPHASRYLYLNSPFNTPIPRYATKLPNRVLEAIPTFTNLAHVHIEQIVLREGETLYIPPFWWHEVETLEPSASLAIRYKVSWHKSLSARVFELLVLQMRFALLQYAAKLILRNNLAHMLR